MKIINWIKNLFKKSKVANPPIVTPPAKPIPEIPSKEETQEFPKKRIAIIVGHGNGDGGADTIDGSNEFEYNSFVAEYVKKNSKQLVETFYRGPSGIVGVGLKAVAWKADISIELHLNSFNGIARGCEVLVLNGDKESAKIGTLFARSFCEKFSRVLRGDNGIKWLSTADRGGASLKAVSPIKQSILVEPLFCDNRLELLPKETYAKFLTNFVDEL
jgi:N-acetylmuramoyl-L-alanine amidase